MGFYNALVRLFFVCASMPCSSCRPQLHAACDQISGNVQLKLWNTLVSCQSTSVLIVAFDAFAESPSVRLRSNLLQAASLAMASPSFICSLQRDSSRRDSNASNSSGIQWIHHAFGYFGHAHHERFASLDPETVLKGSDWARARAAPGFHLPLGDTLATSQVGRI